MRRRAFALLPLFAGLLLTASAGRPALADGIDLDGRMAPDMTFPGGLNGIAPGTTLSSFRNRVVLIEF